MRCAPLLLLPLLAPALAAAGTCGPADAFGYECFDDEDSAGPSFNWETPSTSVGVGGFQLPFTFWFYGQPFDSLSVQANGYATLGGGAGSLVGGNNCLPVATTAPLLMPFWSSLSISGGTVTWETYGAAPNRHVTVAWADVSPSAPVGDSSVSFQLKLFETSNTIEFHYLDTEFGLGTADEGADATAGISFVGNGYQQYSCDTASLPNLRAILFDGGCADDDGDGIPACGGDCDDANPDNVPGGTEDCTDGQDNDCDGDVDGDDVDCPGDDDDSGDDDDATGDDDDATGDDDDTTGDDDDSGDDDDDATGDDDDTADDDDATGDDDDSGGDDSAVHVPVGCLAGCSAGGGASATPLLFLLPLLLMRRRRSASFAVLAGLALTAGLATAAPVVITDTGEQAVALGGDNVVGGVWILGVEPDRICPESVVTLDHLRESTVRARRAVDELDLDGSRATLAELRQTLACLAEPPDTAELWEVHFLEAVALTYAAAPQEAIDAALARAHAIRPGTPFDRSYPPEIRDAFLRTQQDALAAGTARVVASDAPPQRAGAVWVDGRKVGGQPLDLIPGPHLVQLRDGDGVLRGLEVTVADGDVLLAAQPEALAAVRGQAPAPEQERLDRWVLAWTGLDGTVQWEQPAATPEPDASGKRPGPRLLVLLGGGYGAVARDSYGQTGFDLSVKIVGPLRVDASARLGFAPATAPDGSDDTVVLGAYGGGLSLRFATPAPVAPLVGVGGHVAPNRDGSEGERVLGGVVGRVGLDIAPAGPLALRIVGEAGNLGRFFVGRALVQVGVGLGR